MGAINPAIYEEMEISAETTTGTPKTIDLKLGVVSINYYEDLFSRCLTAQLLIVSSGGATQTDVKDGESGETIENVYSGLPIRGGERVKIKIKANTEKNAALEFDSPEKYFYESNVSKQFSDGSKEIFTLDLVSREAITNETSRVVKRYPKESKISDHVKTIIQDRLASTIEDEDIDETVNKYGFIGNLKKPFHVLVWLASKSKPKKGLPGYFFYQTKDGFKFKSIDKLISDGKKSDQVVYEEVNYKPSSKLSDVADFTILQYNITQNNDLITKLALGQFSSHFMEFDPLTGSFTTQEQGKFTVDQITRQSIDFEVLGETPEVPKLLTDDKTQNLGTLPSRLITMVTDRGTLDFEPGVDKNSDPKLWQRQAYMRYQLLFTQILNMVVPLNTNLSVGDIIFVRFLKSNMESKEKDRRQSGNYMIKELCHHFDANQSLTSMTLIRDTFGEISE